MNANCLCPDCGTPTSDSLGELPDVPFFAGQRLTEPLPGGELLLCGRCDLRFRAPTLGDGRYAELYNNARVDTWTVGTEREDQRLVREQIERFTSPDNAAAPALLDFGCYVGDLLAQLPAGLQKFGVEISASAAAQAIHRTGASVVQRMEDLPNDLRFDVIIAMDVVEHVASPRALLLQLAARLKPGGRLLVTTGDGRSTLWRILGARWWYCHFPEHISFISANWAEHHAAEVGLRVVDLIRFNYLRRSDRPNIAGWWKLLRFALFRSTYAAKQRRHRQKRGTDLVPPGIGLTADHLLIVFERRI